MSYKSWQRAANLFGCPCMLCTVHGRQKKKLDPDIDIIYIALSSSPNSANFMDPSLAARFTIVGLNQRISHGCLGWNTQTSQIYHQIAISSLISWFYWVCIAHGTCLLQRKCHFRWFTFAETHTYTLFSSAMWLFPFFSGSSLLPAVLTNIPVLMSCTIRTERVWNVQLVPSIRK